MKSNKELLFEVETEALNIIAARDATIAAQSAALALAREALGGALVVIETVPRPYDFSRELNIALDRRIEAIHNALAAIKDVVKQQ